mgnify:CR=1 FL=1
MCVKRKKKVDMLGVMLYQKVYHIDFEYDLRLELGTVNGVKKRSG